MRIGFVYEPFDARAGSFGAHGHFLAHELVRRGHELWGPGLPAMPGLVSLAANKWGKLTMLRHVDLLYIRVGVLHWLERCTLLRLLRPMCPVVWEINGTSEEILAGASPSADALRRCRRDVRRKRWMAPLVDAAVCVGESLADYARRCYGLRRCVAVPNGGDLSACMPQGGGTVLGSLPNRFKVFWAGDAGLPWQGLDLIFEAARQCERIAPDVLFVLLLGGKRPPAGLPHRCNTLCLAGTDRLTAHRYLADADCAMAVYRESPWRALPTGFPLKVMDAMAARKPVIADAHSTDIVRDGVDGLIIPATGDALVHAILRLRGDAGLRERLAASARERIESGYTWRHVVDQIEPLLFELIGRGSAKRSRSTNERAPAMEPATQVTALRQAAVPE